MIERIMLFKLHDPTRRDALAAATLGALSKLSDVEELSVGVPADAASEKSWDLSVVLGFANVALLNNVLAGAPFTAYLDGTMGGQYAVLKAWSFERIA